MGRSYWFVGSCFGENGLRINEENRSRPGTTVVPVRRQFSEKEQNRFSPSKPIFDPWDAIPTTPNICQPQGRSLDVGRPGLVRTSYIQVYKAASTSMVLSRPKTRTDEHEKTAHVGRSCSFVASSSGRIRFVLNRRIGFVLRHKFRKLLHDRE